MKVVFVALGAEQLGISQLVSILKNKGHQVELVFTASLFNDRYNLEIPWLNKYFDETELVVSDILKHQADVIAFSCLTSTFQWAIAVTKKVKDKQPNIKSIFGGVHVSAVPEICLSYPEVDFAVVGEGDVAMLDILKDIEEGGSGLPIPNTQFLNESGELIKGKQVGFYQELDDLPLPDKIIWEPHINLRNNYLIMASRGCPYTCSFCFNNFFARLPDGKRGKYVRQRSVKNVMIELKWAKSRYHLQTIDFEDDVFTVNKPWIREFCEAYQKEINLPFSCLIHPHYFDEEIAQLLSFAGCTWVQMGIQTMDENFKHQNLRRYEESDHIINALKLLKKYKINVKVDQMLGLPGEAIESQETALALYKECTPERIQTFWTTFLPGTEMFRKALEDGTINDEQARRLNHGEDFYFFRNQENIKDPELVRQYANYEFIYRILPALPNYFKKRITQKSVNKIPDSVKNLLGKVLDVYVGFVSVNSDFSSYAKFYLFNLWKFSLRRLGYNGFKVAKVYLDEEIPVFNTEVEYEEVNKG